MAKGFGSCISTRLGAGVIALLLGSCGDGGGGGGGTPPPPPAANRPPAITSPATANAAENAAGAVYAATATDPDGNPLTFSLSGGADRAAFTITAGGALSFAQPPDFETPTDTDANNIYLVQLAVSDGTTSATLDLALTVTNVGPDAFRVRRVGAGFTIPVFLAGIPDGSGRVLVVQQGGLIRILDPATGTIAPTPFLDVSAQTTTTGERGLLGLALAPDFNATGTFYIFMTDPNGRIQLRRYRTFAGNRNQADPATADQIFDLAHPATNHNGGWLEFGPDGMLYAALGDGGTGGETGQEARPRSWARSSVSIREPTRFPPIRCATMRSRRAIPSRRAAARPKSGPTGSGIRTAPASTARRRTSGSAMSARVQREEIDLMRPVDAGANFGWRIMEGTVVFNGTPNASLVPPVAEYAHGAGPREGNVVTGGYVYRGPVEALRGNYFFADFAIRNIWSIPVVRAVIGQTIPSSQFRLRNADFTPVAGTINNVSSFGLDQSGHLYIVDYDGEIYRVEPA